MKKRAHQRFRHERPRPFHRPLPVVVVACDDTQIAVNYFNEIKREVKAQVTVDVVPARRRGASADDVVTAAIMRARGLRRFHDSEDKGESVWALIDLETEPSRVKAAYHAKTRATGVKVALSNPCFEVWTLAHFLDTGTAFKNCGAVVDRIQQKWHEVFGTSFDKKAQADYSKLMVLRDAALLNANKRDTATDQSWTEVHKVVEAIFLRCK